MPQNFCEDEDSGELVNRTQFDYMMLFKALNPIHVTTKEFLENKLTNDEAYKKVKMQYSTYKCKLRKDIDDNRSSKDTINELFYILVLIVSIVYTLWVVYQLYKALTGSCEVNKYSLPILYSVMSLVLFNPFFSLITITFEMLKYRNFQKMEKSKWENLTTIEQKIESALDCGDSSNFTKDTVCDYYAYFDKDGLCDNPRDINDNEMMTDFITNKMEKLDSVNQFFENQKKFLLKINNPIIEIKKGDKIDPVIEFLLGSNIEKLVRDNLNTSDADDIFSENSQQIRNNASKNLKLIESYKYTQIGDVVSYEEYFLRDLNVKLQSLTANVLKFLEKSADNRNEYFKNNQWLKNYKTEDVYSFFCGDPGEDFDTPNFEADILEDMFQIQLKLRRLNKLWLPEYEYLRKIIYEPPPVKQYTTASLATNEHVPFRVDLKTQRAMYRTNIALELKPMLKEIVAIVLENTHLIRFDHDIKVRFYSDNARVPRCDIMSDEDGNVPNIKTIQHVSFEDFNVELLYAPDYKTQDTMLIPKVKSFVTSLRKDPLPKNFKTQFKVETSIVKNILVNELNGSINNVKTLVDYVRFYIKDKNVFTQAQQTESITFVSNCNKLITHANKQYAQETKNSELYFNTNKTVENPDKYISFEEFEVKLNNIEKPQYNQYLETIESVKNDVSYFIEKLDDMNNRMESKLQMTEFYKKYIIIYSIASFVYMLNTSIDTYYDSNALDRVKARMCSRIKGDTIPSLDTTSITSPDDKKEAQSFGDYAAADRVRRDSNASVASSSSDASSLKSSSSLSSLKSLGSRMGRSLTRGVRKAASRASSAASRASSAVRETAKKVKSTAVESAKAVGKKAVEKKTALSQKVEEKKTALSKKVKEKKTALSKKVKATKKAVGEATTAALNKLKKPAAQSKPDEEKKKAAEKKILDELFDKYTETLELEKQFSDESMRMMKTDEKKSKELSDESIKYSRLNMKAYEKIEAYFKNNEKEIKAEFESRGLDTS